jgi:hypothetical protein
MFMLSIDRKSLNIHWQCGMVIYNTNIIYLPCQCVFSYFMKCLNDELCPINLHGSSFNMKVING